MICNLDSMLCRKADFGIDVNVNILPAEFVMNDMSCDHLAYRTLGLYC
jgi:hypothetical protein